MSLSEELLVGVLRCVSLPVTAPGESHRPAPCEGHRCSLATEPWSRGAVYVDAAPVGLGIAVPSPGPVGRGAFPGSPGPGVQPHRERPPACGRSPGSSAWTWPEGRGPRAQADTLGVEDWVGCRGIKQMLKVNLRDGVRGLAPPSPTCGLG